MHISKLDAAHRQLESAVRLFFLNGDPVAIHTLTGAARSLLRDLAQAEGREGVLDAMFTAGIRPERLGEVRGMLVEAQNFFKHADRDPGKVLDFNPRTTEFLLWDVCVLYGALTAHQLPLLAVFGVWFGLAHPNILTPQAQQHVNQIQPPFDTRDRRRFLSEMLPVAEEWCAGTQPGSN